MTISRILAGASGLALLIAIVWAVLNAPLGEALAVIGREPWWLVTLIDLYAGFILASLIIVALEPDRLTAILWIVPLYFLGNLVLAAWLLLRGFRILSLYRERLP